MLDSLVRVSRRAADDHYASILAMREPRSPQRYCAMGYNTPGGATFPKPLSHRENRCWPEPGRVHQRERWMIHLAQVWSQALPFQQFHELSNPLIKVLYIFRSLYLFAIGLWPIFSFRRHLPPILSSIPKLLDSSKELYRGLVSNYTVLSHSVASRSRELSRHRTKSILNKLQLGPKPDFKFELLPLHSPLLWQSLLVSFPPLIDMLKFSGYSYLIRGQPCEN